jgi:ATP-dependent DNA ligase
VPDAFLHAFDLLELNGKDLRPLPLGERKAKLARLQAGSAAGVFPMAIRGLKMLAVMTRR